MNSLRRHFHRIDLVVKLDANRWFLERVIERRDPFYLQRISYPDRGHLQIGKRPPAFRLDQAVYDEIKRASNGKRFARRDSEGCRLDTETLRGFLLVFQNYFDRETFTRVAVLKINVFSRVSETNGVSRFEINLRARRQLLALTGVDGNRKIGRAEFSAPILHHERFPGGVFKPWSECQPMVRAGDDSTDRECAFGLTFPEKRTFKFRRAYKRRRLITYINQIRRNHPQWERDRDRVALGNFTARRFHNDAARIGLGVRCFFLLISVRARRGELTEDDRARYKQAKRYRD